MKLQEAADFLRSLLAQTDHTSEKKIYQTFWGILTDLIRRDLPESQVYAIEDKLDQLQLTAPTDKPKKYLKKKLSEFESYLEKEFSLIKEEHHQNTGIALGMSYGMVAGMIFGPSFGISNGLVIGMALGMIIGLLIGQNKDKQAKEENLVMNTKMV